MAILKCKMCGADLTPKENEKICECEFCGTKQTISSSSDEKVLKTISRGSMLRNKCEFDKARTLYEQLITENLADAEVYWNIVLCKYGITYVDDYDGSKKPTINRMSNILIIDDDDFKKCLELSDVVTRTQYEIEANQIADIQKEILTIANKEQPYDIFISYKETDEFGERTRDSLRAYEIYESLTKEGYRVFLSRVVLSSVAGQNYEPYIYSALYSAKAMILISSQEEYVNAVWVKNEWSRFLALMKKDRSKVLIPCYFDMDPYDLPKEIRNIQALDMSKLGFIQDLLLGVNKIFNKNKDTSQVTNKFDKEFAKKMMFLGEFDKAIKELDKAISSNSEDAEVYLMMLMAKNQFYDETFEKIKNIKDFNENSYFKIALTYSKDSLKNQLESFLTSNEEFIIEEGILIKYIGNTKITKLVIPNGVERINKGWLEGENNIEEIVLPKSCKKIGDDAFDGFENLEKINLENVEVIGNRAFGDSYIREVIFGDKIKRIGYEAFYAPAIEKFIFPNIFFSNKYNFFYFQFDSLKYAKMPIKFFFELFDCSAEKATIELYDDKSIDKIVCSSNKEYYEYGELVVPNSVKEFVYYSGKFNKLTFINKDCLLEVIAEDYGEKVKEVNINPKSLVYAYKDTPYDNNKKRLLEQIIANGGSLSALGLLDAAKRFGLSVPQSTNGSSYYNNAKSSTSVTTTNGLNNVSQIQTSIGNTSSSNLTSKPVSTTNGTIKKGVSAAYLELQRLKRYHKFGLAATILALLAAICIFLIKGDIMLTDPTTGISVIVSEGEELISLNRGLVYGTIFLLSTCIVCSVYYFVTLRNGKDTIGICAGISTLLGIINLIFLIVVINLQFNNPVLEAYSKYGIKPEFKGNAAYWLSIIFLSLSIISYLYVLVHSLIKKYRY